MPMYNLIEYSNNYSDTSESLWQFKRDETPATNTGNLNINTKNSSSFKYKSNSLGKSATVVINNANNGALKNAKIAVRLKYLNIFWRSLECKIHLELNWTKSCVMSSAAGNTEFK